MRRQKTIIVQKDGTLQIPEEMKERMGYEPGEELVLEEQENGLVLKRSIDHLSRIYIEPTSRCNLECSTCIRNAWDEKPGHMNMETFQRILQGYSSQNTVPEIFFGGFGEPLSHPHILEMLEQARKRARTVELISNGILLDKKMAHELVKLNIDRVWISIDGASPESYEDVRLGNELKGILENLKYLKELRRRSQGNSPSVGITFVAMKRNISDIEKVHNLMFDVGADVFHVSNLLPHTENMKEEILYSRSLGNWTSKGDTILFPRMDMNQNTMKSLQSLLSRYETDELAGSHRSSRENLCPFFEKRSVSIRFDGQVSPCLPLLHSSSGFFKGSPRMNHDYSFGDVNNIPLLDIWQSSEYSDFRRKLSSFDFSPCTSCTGCDLSEENREDCFGSEPISCGGCLWAQGYIQCP